MNHFDRDTGLTRETDGRWSGVVSPHWAIGDNPNGGYLVAITLRALRELAPTHPDPLSVTTHYLRPATGGEAFSVTAEIVRAGRGFSTGRATLVQAGKPRIEVLATLGDLGEPRTSSADLTLGMPTMPAPADCVLRSGEEQGVDLPILDRLEIRLHPEQAKAGRAGRAVVSGWIRCVDDRPPDTLAAVTYVDAFPPSLFGLIGAVGWVPTIELTVHVRRRPQPGWMLGQCITEDFCDSRMIENGVLWDSAGNLVAQSRQIALLLRSDG